MRLLVTLRWLLKQLLFKQSLYMLTRLFIASIYLHCSRNIGAIHKYVSDINNIYHNKPKQPPFLLAFQITQFVEPEFSSPQ